MTIEGGSRGLLEIMDGAWGWSRAGKTVRVEIEGMRVVQSGGLGSGNSAYLSLDLYSWGQAASMDSVCKPVPTISYCHLNPPEGSFGLTCRFDVHS